MVYFALLGTGLGLLGADNPALVAKPETPKVSRLDTVASDPRSGEPQAAPSVPAVIIEGRRPRRRIDRERYSNDQEPGLQNSTVADALRRVPSLAVDANGRIYLRGRTDVQVYIDGQPSALMGAEARDLVLNAMPSAWVSAIELITVPNAGMANGNGGPIINLITNPNRKPGGFASGEVSANGSGQTGANLSGSYGASRWTVNAGFSLRDDRQDGDSSTRIETYDATRALLSLSQAENNLRVQTRNRAFSGGLSFAPNALNRLSAQVVLTHSTRNSAGRLRNAMTDGAAVTQGLYEQIQHRSDDTRGQALTLNWTYSDLDIGETVKLNLNASRSKAPSRSVDQFIYSAPNVRQSQAERLTGNRTSMTTLSLDYERPLGDGLVTTGLSYNWTRADSRTGATGEGVIDNSLLSNQYRDRQTISAVYGTYQRPFGDYWVAQAGLRAEAYHVASDQGGRELEDRYTHWTPSLFLLHEAKSGAKLRFAYSREQQSASLQARNPSLVYEGPQTLNQGNPNLKAQTTDNFELGYETFSERGATQLRLYYAPTRGGLFPVSRVLADGVIVREQENGGAGYSLGFDVNGGRQLTSKLNLQFQFGVARNSRQNQNGNEEQVTALSGQASLNYSLSDSNNITFLYMVQGSGFTGQGASEPFSASSLSYSYTFSPELTLNIDVQNPLGRGVTRQRYETPTLVTTNESRSHNRLVMLTLRRRFVTFAR